MSNKRPKEKHTIGFKNKKGKTCIISPLNGENKKATYLTSGSNCIEIMDEDGIEKSLDKIELKYILFGLGKNSLNRHGKYLNKKETERMETKKNDIKPKEILADKIGSKVKIVFIDGKAINDAQLIALSKFEINITKENKEMIVFKHAIKYVQIIES